MSQEWAIQDEATGKYLLDVKDEPQRWVNYRDVARYLGVQCTNDRLRIVPAPPREMTDAEAEAWFLSCNQTLTLHHTEHHFFVAGVRDERLGTGEGWVGPACDRIFDAIRAARRKIESGK